MANKELCKARYNRLKAENCCPRCGAKKEEGYKRVYCPACLIDIKVSRIKKGGAK